MTSLPAKHLTAGLTIALIAGLGPSPAHAKSLKVDCDKGQSIQKALDSAVPGDMVEISGANCDENIRIVTDNVTLSSTVGTGITAADNTKDTVTVSGANNVVLVGLAISGGEDGVQVDNNGSVALDGVTIDGAADDGVAAIQSSHVSAVNGTTVGGTTPPGDDGIALVGASATVNGSFVKGAETGLNVVSSSSASASGSTFAGARRAAVVSASQLSLSVAAPFANTFNSPTAAIFCSQGGALRCGVNQSVNAPIIVDSPGPFFDYPPNPPPFNLHCTQSHVQIGNVCPASAPPP